MHSTSNRAAKPQPELDEVIGGDGSVFVEIKDRAGTSKCQAELDEVIGRDRTVAIKVAEKAEESWCCRGVAHQHEVVATDSVAIAIKLARWICH